MMPSPIISSTVTVRSAVDVLPWQFGLTVG